MLFRRLHTLARAQFDGSAILRLFVKETFWSFLGSVITNGGNLITAVLMARILGRAEYGQYIFLMATLTAVTAFAWFGVGTIATRFSAQLRNRDPERLGRVLSICQDFVVIVSLIATSSLTLAHVWLASHAFNAPSMAFPLALAALSVAFSALDGLQKNVLIGMSAMRQFSTGSIIGMVVAVPATLGLAYFHGITGAALGITFAAMVNFAISRWQVHRLLAQQGIQLARVGSWREVQVLANVGLPGLIVGVLPALAQWAVQSMLTQQKLGFEELAIYGIAVQWFHIVNFLPGTSTRALTPLLMNSVAEANGRQVRKLLIGGVSVATISALGVALCGIWLAPQILAAYGPQFSGGSVVLIIAIAASVINSAQAPVQNLLVGQSKMWIVVWIAAASMAIFVVIAAFLKHEGAIGAVTALAIGICLQATLIFGYAWLSGHLHD